MRCLCVVVFILVLPINAFAQDKNEEIDLIKLEYQIYKDLKSQSTGDDALIHQAIGYALLEFDNSWKRAIVHFKKAVELDQTLFFCWYNLGLLYVDDEEGRDYFRRSIEANVDFAPAYYWLAYSCCRNRRDNEAIPVLKKYLEIAKDDPHETDRFEFAQKLMEELRTGEEGETLKMIRKPLENST